MLIFLSQTFVELDGVVLPKPEREKVLASALYANEVEDVRFTLLRLFALRIESWPCLQTRNELKTAIGYLFNKYEFELKGNIPDTQLQWKDIAAVNKTDAELWRLYALPRLEPGRAYAKEFSVPCSRRDVRNGLTMTAVCQSASVSNDGCYCFVGRSHGDARKVFTTAEMPSKQKGKGKPKNPNKQKSKPKGKKSARNGSGMWSTQSAAAPVAYGSVSQNRQSRVTRIAHRESLGPVVSTGTGFQVLFNLPVQPALPSSFPWLSAIGTQYETYAPRKTKSRKGARAHCIRYCYETRCSTGTAGTVVQATNYDASEAAFTSLTQAENYRGATVCQPWIRACHELEVDSMRDYNRHYTRAGAAPSGTDIKTYDVGNYQLMVSGVAAGQIGELYVEYDIDFFDPRVPVPIGQNLPTAHIVSSAGGATAAAPFGTGAVVRAGSNLPGVAASGTTLTLPAVGRYLIAVIYESTTLSTVAVLTASTGVVNGPNIMEANTTYVASVVNANSQALAVYIFDVTAPNGLVIMSGGGTYTGGNTDVFITQISSGLTSPSKSALASLEIEELAMAVERRLGAKMGTRNEKTAHPIVVEQSDDDEKNGFVSVAARAARIETVSTTPVATTSQAALGTSVGKQVQKRSS